MDHQTLVEAIRDRAAGADDAFPLLQAIKEAVRSLGLEFPEITLDSVLAAASEAFDTLIEPIDLPGPDMLIDPLLKAALLKGIDSGWNRWAGEA